MPTPFTLSGEFNYPVEPGLPNSPIPFEVTEQFSSKVDLELNYTGSGTETVPLGTPGLQGLKALLVEFDYDPDASPIYLVFNGGNVAGEVEVSPGGFVAYGNPSPLTGILSITIRHTTIVKVRVRGLA